MKKTLLLTLVAATVSIIACSCNNAGNAKGNTAQTPTNSTASANRDSLVKRGQYIVVTSGCNDCHTPKKITPQGPVPEESLLLSGRPADAPLGKIDLVTIQSYMLFAPDLTAAVGPWGVSFAANITSDSTGIGNWTEQQFFKVMREGKYMGLDSTRPILPPMPWQDFRNFTDDDLKAIFAYLKSTKPVHNVVPQPIPPTEIAKLAR